jgi:hypothetical protein
MLDQSNGRLADLTTSPTEGAWASGEKLTHDNQVAPIGIAVVGCGYWGPNLARNVS